MSILGSREMAPVVPDFEDLELYLDANIERKGDLLVELAEKHNLDIFIETGTYAGEMVKYVDDRWWWQQIYSIELSARLADRAKKLFITKKHIHIIPGDSGEIFKNFDAICIFRQPCLFWLDAHACGGVTARGRKITPLIEELQVIPAKIKHVIVIDDLDNLPKWGISVKNLERYVSEKWTDHTIRYDFTMMIVEPK